MNLVPDCDVLLVVATETERDACLTLFSELLGASHSLLLGVRRTYFDLGIVEGAKVCMVQCEMGSGAPGAAQSTVADAVDDLRPGSVIMVGISFGFDPKKQKIGQVLVSKQLKPYEVQRVGTDKSGQPEIVSRGDKVTASTSLLGRFRSSSVDWGDGQVSFGLLLSGEKLIDNVDFRNAVAQFELEAIGGEMEGAGLYASCVDRNTSWIIVKAICDWADGRKSSNKKKRQALAANNAASFVLHTLKKGGFSKETSQTTTDSPSSSNTINGSQAGPTRHSMSLSERTALISRVRDDLIYPRLHQGLREAIRIEFRLATQPNAVVNELKLFRDLETGGETSERVEGDVLSIFESAAGGRLLILGDPGTGKTTLILELADALLELASNDHTKQIPVLFNLSRWNSRLANRSISDWMIDDLRLYGVSTETSKRLVENGHILPLFDGLDELADLDRPSCVEEINRYQRSRDFGRIAVCCRTDEYNEIGALLELQTAIVVETLPRSTVESVIQDGGFSSAQDVLDADPDLWKIITTPLWLHVLFLASQVDQPKVSFANPRDRLYARYVEYALGRHAPSSPRVRTARRKLLAWLGCLAERMKTFSHAQFVLEDMSLAWTHTQERDGPRQASALDPAASLLPKRGQRLAFGLVLGLIAWSLGGPIFGTAIGVLAFVYYEGRIEPSEELEFNWRRAIDRINRAILHAVLFGAFFAVDIYLFFDVSAVGVFSGGVLAGIVAVAFEFLQSGFRPKPLSNITSPNAATARSTKYALKIFGTGICLSILVIFSGNLVEHNAEFGPATDSPFSRASSWIAFLSILLAAEKGGWFALRHYVIRSIVWLEGCAPLRYVRFLDESVERLFLIRRGGAYEFIHLTFRDFIADNFHSHYGR